MSNGRQFRRRPGGLILPGVGDHAPTPNLSAYELVATSEVVKHTCGHAVKWDLLPGTPPEFLLGIKGYACPCCGGETGEVPEGVEWPDHVLFAGVGLAHCHEEILSCKAVDKAHRSGRMLRAVRR